MLTNHIFQSDKNYRTIKQFLLNHPEYATDKAHCQEIMNSSSDVAYLSEVTYLKEVQKQFCNGHYNGPLILLNEFYFPGYFGLAFGKKFSYKRQISME